MFQAALLGGLFIGVLSALPIVNVANCCCLWIAGGGALSAYLARQDTAPPVSPRQGAVAGLLAGVVGAAVWLVAFAALDVVVGPLEQRMVAAMLDRSVDIPPDVRDMLATIGQQASSPVRYVLGFLFQLFAGAIFSTLGGLLGAIFFHRDTPAAPGGDPVPPPSRE